MLPQRSPDRSPAAPGSRLPLRDTIAIRRHSLPDTASLHRLAESVAIEVARPDNGNYDGAGERYDGMVVVVTAAAVDAGREG